MVVKSLITQLQNRFHVSAAELDEQDTHQIIVIGVAAIVPHNAIADSLMEKISQFVESAFRSGSLGGDAGNTMMIYIDADACPVTRIAESIACRHSIPVTLLCDTNHVLTSDYSVIKVIGAGADAVDIALINLCQRGDVVITQDYGVAALALGKGCQSDPPEWADGTLMIISIAC